MVYFDVRKQKVIWILKCMENDEKAAGNAFNRKLKNSTISNIISLKCKEFNGVQMKISTVSNMIEAWDIGRDITVEISIRSHTSKDLNRKVKISMNSNIIKEKGVLKKKKNYFKNIYMMCSQEYISLT